MTDQVWVAANRRGEMAVARRLQASVAKVARVVVGLLERSQDEARQCPAPVPPGGDPPFHQLRGLTHDLRCLLRGQRSTWDRGCRDPQGGELLDQALGGGPVRWLVHAVERG